MERHGLGVSIASGQGTLTRRIRIVTRAMRR